MLYNKDYLFVHYPKTAGKSVSVFFCQNFEKPVHGLVTEVQRKEIGLTPEDGVHLETGTGHENLTIASRRLAERGRKLENLRAILAVVRNPYDLMVSNYFFLRQSYERNPAMRTRENFKLAAESSFEQFCERFAPASFKGWVTIDGRQPTIPVEIITFENLAGDLSQLLSKYGIPETHPLPHLNPSKRGHYAEMYNSRTKQLVDEKLHDLFIYGRYLKSL